MLEFLRDQLNTIQLRARYRRLVQEQLLEMAETGPSRPHPDDDDALWKLAGSTTASFPDSERTSIRDQARQLVRTYLTLLYLTLN